MNTLYHLAWLDIVKAIPVESTVPIASFANAVLAIHHMQTQDTLNQRLTVVTKDDAFFWVLPIELAQRLTNRGFRIIPTEPTALALDILPESKVTFTTIEAS
ncbi:hypothetical protein [Fibrisoma limi]|uniref:hypothetical protein n=1 Tax=Fibrisoma limi TaxID=663275 RepID=UPI000587A483|nr:hypothetical protein [Fibrisoma limi]